MQAHFPIRGVVLAGLAGGLAELVWVGLYAGFGPLEASRVAHEVTASFVATPMSAMSVWLGVAVHLLLALAVAFGFAALLWWPLARHRAPVLTWVLAAATLSAVWAVNFGVVLPVLNPAFVTLMPPGVTLASKLLFGMSMAAVLTPCTATLRAPNPRAPVRV